MIEPDRISKPESIKGRWMTLVTVSQRRKLLASGMTGMTPILKLFGGSVTLLLTGERDGLLYGFVDLGMGCVEWGAIMPVDELPRFTVQLGLPLERDLFFKPKEIDLENFSELARL